MARRERAVLALLCTVVMLGAACGAIDEIVELYRTAKEKMDGMLVYSKDLLCVSAGVHGLMNKTAVQRDWKESDPTSMTEYVRHEMPIYYRSMLYISDKHRFIYVRHSKASSTTLRLMLSRQFCERRLCGRHELRYSSTDRIDPPIWRDYFIFTFVRNPWTRMASAYTFFHESLVATKLPDGSIGERCTTVPFREFTENTFNMYRACELRSCCVLMPGFGGKSDHFHQENLNPHIGDLNHHVFTTDGKSMVDFIGRTEKLHDDWLEVLAHLSRRNGYAYEPVAEKSHNRKHSDLSGNCSASYYESMYDADTLRNVALQYAVDVQRFQYYTPDLLQTH